MGTVCLFFDNIVFIYLSQLLYLFIYLFIYFFLSFLNCLFIFISTNSYLSIYLSIYLVVSLTYIPLCFVLLTSSFLSLSLTLFFSLYLSIDQPVNSIAFLSVSLCFVLLTSTPPLSLSLYIYIYIYIYLLELLNILTIYKGVKTTDECPGYNTKLLQMVRLCFWRFVEWRVHHHYHYSQVHANLNC